MELIEREEFLVAIKTRFDQAAAGEGHCLFITGEAGIGKTSLLRAFLKQVRNDCDEYVGACDSLFTPRPLGPLYDISLQMKGDWTNQIQSLASRAALFTNILEALINAGPPVVLVFEDIHWADEATLDFIKFLSRRIGKTKCVFILTYRDNEIDQQHPLNNLPAELSHGSFSHLSLIPLSRQAVQKLADKNGFDGQDLFSISGGNPFYINEILASGNRGVPDNVKSAILAIFNRQDEKTKKTWQFLSVMPEGLELKRLSKIDIAWQEAIEHSLEKKILILVNQKLFFKHELFRRAIEDALSPIKRMALNRHLLDLFLHDFVNEGEVERIVQYAAQASDHQLVIQYAPVAAKKAASVGAHIEASKLLLTAIEYAGAKDEGKLVELYEMYAYECYLTNQIKSAIVYLDKALRIHENRNDIEKTGNCLRFLSRLWWFDGNNKNAEHFGFQAIDMLDREPASKAKAMAYSNMAQLKMLADDTEACLHWGEKAIAVATEIGDEETLAHAWNSISSSLTLHEATMEKGLAMLQQSLELSLKNGYHEHVARAYTNMGSNSVAMKNYKLARTALDEGINYCDERDLYSWKAYMSGWKARLNLETGNWKDAEQIAETLLANKNQASVVRIGVLVVMATLYIRRGKGDALTLLTDAKASAFDTRELQRIVPVLIALMEYEWLSGQHMVDEKDLADAIAKMAELKRLSRRSRFYFWLEKTRRLGLLPDHFDELANIGPIPGELQNYWEQIESPYEMALSLFDKTDDDKRKALSILQGLGASAVYEKLKMDMRASGIGQIPRGIRDSTKNNPAQLTIREVEVLSLLKKGSQNKEIAASLFISPKTVDHHISSILFKLDVSSRTKAVAEAARRGML